MQIKFYHHFIKFLARLAEVVVSLLRTLKNNLSDLVVTFARSAFQRRSAVIKVFLVSVVVALGRTWQDLDLLGPGLLESVGKFALVPFAPDIRKNVIGKLSQVDLETSQGKRIVNDLNEMKRKQDLMESEPTAKQEKIFQDIRALSASINKNLKILGKTPVEIFGSKPAGEDLVYSAGRTPERSVWYKDKESAIRASQPKGAKDDYKLTESVVLKKEETKYIADGPAYSAPRRVWSLMRNARSRILKGKHINYKPFPGFERLLQGLSRDDKVKKIYDLQVELTKNPSAFQIKHNIKSRVAWTDEDMYGGSKQINTATTQREAAKDIGFYQFETDAPKNPVVVSPDNPEAAKAAAKKIAEQNKELKSSVELQYSMGLIEKPEYDKKMELISGRSIDHPLGNKS